MSREWKILAYVAAGLVAVRALVLMVDSIAESIERSELRH